jgi:hypothetical protein
MPPEAEPADIQDERRRARRVRMIADFTCAVIMQSRMARSEAEALIVAARARILELFPGREDTYELLYASRFRRILDEFALPDLADQKGRVLRFARRRTP